MLLLFLIAFTGLWVTHFNLLRLPYFWDEAGYFVPAAHDLFLRGDLIPVSVVSNAHPPLVAAYLAAWWKLAGFTPIVTRSAMLLFAAFALLGVYRLALPMAGERAALSAALCVAAYPVFFAQASLAQLDLAAAAFSIWGIAFWLERRPWACAFLFCLAVMAKETAVVTVLALLLVSLWDKRRLEILLLLLPLATLAAWLAYHYARTGVIFGNAEFLRYNLGATVHTKRIAIALALRLWHSLAHLGLFALTLPAAAVVLRRRITSPAISVLAFLCLANAAAFSIAGGAILARYLLPVVLLVIVVCVTVISRSIRRWPAVVAIAVAVFIVCLYTYPPYHYALDENLAYRDFVRLHESSARILESRFPTARIGTAWPATDELTKPYLGYVTQPRTVVAVTDFNATHFTPTGDFDAALVFATQYEPAESWLHPGRYLRRLAFWKHTQEEYFDDAAHLDTDAVALKLHGSILWREQRGPLSIAIVVPGRK